MIYVGVVSILCQKLHFPEDNEACVSIFGEDVLQVLQGDKKCGFHWEII